ncbi:hypothetical protein JTE90_021456 [Oedothorax gibbosus]|uniref:Uncharacterized protein n=1 Tax=Oedothorax gibbosus TaxID=931172 RepID=A0AAV6VY38_9ARAC|nr:hypothetical protein JTE90_021456 [Oedothorax gibbosus]
MSYLVYDQCQKASVEPWGNIGVSRRILTTDKMKGYAPPSRVVSDYWTLLGHVTPSFDNGQQKNVTTQLGQTVYLHCVVNNLGDKTVSFC